MKTRVIATLIGIAAIGTMKPAVAQSTPSFQIVDIPLLSGIKESFPSAINSEGQVVGGSRGSNSPKVQYGWVWTPYVGTVPVLPTREFYRSYAFDINDAGTVVGRGYNNDWGSTSTGKALLWLEGAYSTPIDLNAALLNSGYLSGWTLRKAASVSNVVSDPETGSEHYYVVCYGQYVRNGVSVVQAGAVLKMRGATIANAVELQATNASVNPFFQYLNINSMGQVCGKYHESAGTFTGAFNCLWNAEDGQIAFSSAAAPSSSGSANVSLINDAGAIVGEMTKPTGGRHAYISEAPYGKVDYLQTQMSGTDGNSQTIPYGMNNSHQVVGQAVYPSNLARIAAYWKVETYTDPITNITTPLRDGDGNLIYTYHDLARSIFTGTSVVKSFWLAAGINDTGWIVVDAQPTSTTHRVVVLIPNP